MHPGSLVQVYHHKPVYLSLLLHARTKITINNNSIWHYGLENMEISAPVDTSEINILLLDWQIEKGNKKIDRTVPSVLFP